MIMTTIAPGNQIESHKETLQQSDIFTEELLEPRKTVDDSTKFLKIGSLQAFIESEGPIENFSCDLFSADEVHKIAILDLRMMNLDRNECNILVTRQLKEINDAESSLNLSA